MLDISYVMKGYSGCFHWSVIKAFFIDLPVWGRLLPPRITPIGVVAKALLARLPRWSPDFGFP